MEILNVGIWELFFIILLAFIILGPKKAVKAARDVGLWVRDLLKSPIWQEIMSTSNQIRDIPRKVMDDADIKKTIEDLERSTQQINQVLNDSENLLAEELIEPDRQINENLDDRRIEGDMVDHESALREETKCSNQNRENQ